MGFEFENFPMPEFENDIIPLPDWCSDLTFDDMDQEVTDKQDLQMIVYPGTTI